MSFICHTYVIHTSYISYISYICHMWLLLASWNAVGLRQNCSLRCFPHGHHPDSPLHEGAEIHKGAAWIYIQSGLCRCFGKLMWKCSSVHSLTLWPEVFRFSSCAEITLFVPVSPCIVDPPDAFFRNQCSQGQVHYPHRSSLSPRSHEDCTVPLLVKSLLAICAHCLRLPELFVECPWPGRVSN